MKQQVYILATCRDESLLPFTTLVFKTIRIGFPKASICVLGNALDEKASEVVKKECRKVGGNYLNLEGQPTIHHLWLEKYCLNENMPFVLCDTDVIFYEPVEGWKFDTALAGWRIPEFQDEFTNARTRARLHTSLLFVDPVKLREAVAKYQAQFPVTVFNPFANLFHPLCVPFKSSAYFYDTAAMLYHAIGGTAFTDRQLEAYFHHNFGTIPDVVLPRLKDGASMLSARAEIMKNPVLGKGRWREQIRYYESRQ